MNIEFPEYDFPCRMFDFNTEQEMEFDNYRELEKNIQEQFFSNSISQIKNGLSNVLYWGYYRIGYGKTRIKIFRENVTNFQLQAFSDLVKTNMADPISIKKIGLPQFSGFSFISKILMFMDPTTYVVLDKKIMELYDLKNHDNPLTKIPYNRKDSGIRITKISNKYYFEWCELCSFIAKQFQDHKIAVDIERGFFKLAEKDEIEYAKLIIATEMKKLRVLTANNIP